MPLYAYSKPSIIDEVTILKSDGGSRRAYLHASPDASAKQLYDIACRVSEKGLQSIPMTREGKAVLEVRGFSRDNKLLDLLAKEKWLSGAPQISTDMDKPTTFMERVKNRSLFATSVAFLVGDAGFFGYGFNDNSKLDMAAGLLYAGGTLSNLAFSRKDQSDLQIRDLSRKMSDYIRTEGVSLPHECTLDAIIDDKKKGLIRKADDLFRRYPSELMNMFFAGAGICIAAAATHKIRIPASAEAIEKRTEFLLQKVLHKGGIIDHADIAAKALYEVNHERKLEGWMDVGLGSMTFASGMFGTLVKEKAPDPDAPKETGLQGVKQWAQAHPLAVTGYGYMVSTLCHAISTYVAWKSGDPARTKAVPLRAVFVVTNIIAELLLSISSKGHGHGVVSDTSINDTVVALASELIAKQPRKLQPLLVEHVADFLGHPEILALKDKDVRNTIQKQVEAMRENPWAMAERDADKDAGRTPVTVPEMPKKWQGKIVPPEAASGHTATVSI